MEQKPHFDANTNQDALARRVSFFSAAAGYPVTLGSQTEDFRPVDHYIDKGHKLRSAAFTRLLKTLGRAPKRGFKYAFAALKAYRVEYAGRRALLALNAQQLCDIGLTRADALAYAQGKISPDEVNARRAGLSRIRLFPGVKKTIKPEVTNASQLDEERSIAA